MVRFRIRSPARTFTRRTNEVSRIRSATIILSAIFLVACASSEPAPETGRRANDPQSTVGPKGSWREVSVPVPPYPQAENLVEFRIRGTTSFEFFADTESVRVDPDGVVRYTVIARSGSGVENVSFEGIHCEKREFKVYAIGAIDGTWLPPHNSRWKRIEKKKDNDYRNSLHHYYLCPSGFPRINANETILVLKRGRPDFGDYREL